MGSLIMCAVCGNLLGARAQAGHGYDDLQRERVAAVPDFPDESHLIIQQTFTRETGAVLLMK